MAHIGAFRIGKSSLKRSEVMVREVVGFEVATIEAKASAEVGFKLRE